MIRFGRTAASGNGKSGIGSNRQAIAGDRRGRKRARSDRGSRIIDGCCHCQAVIAQRKIADGVRKAVEIQYAAIDGYVRAGGDGVLMIGKERGAGEPQRGNSAPHGIDDQDIARISAGDFNVRYIGC
ncbi:MAG: hypothetical protein IT426_18415 [Pirellulales bacterium]|nr:hypothetical protein [Pirellulales bacterium]